MEIKNKYCNRSFKSFISRIKKMLYFLIRKDSESKFYVFYPPLNADPIKDFDPLNWLSEDFNWFHEANDIAEQANKNNGKIIAIIYEKSK